MVDVTRWAYAAFISYSHAVDGKLAPAIHMALQRFAKPWYRRRIVIPGSIAIGAVGLFWFVQRVTG